MKSLWYAVPVTRCVCMSGIQLHIPFDLPCVPAFGLNLSNMLIALGSDRTFMCTCTISQKDVVTSVPGFVVTHPSSQLQ